MTHKQHLPHGPDHFPWGGAYCGDIHKHPLRKVLVNFQDIICSADLQIFSLLWHKG